MSAVLELSIRLVCDHREGFELPVAFSTLAVVDTEHVFLELRDSNGGPGCAC